jgi:hypothetical protein
MGTANTFRTDLYSIHNYIQNTCITHPKEVFIETLRNFFADGSYYHYVKDEWGFPLTPDLTGVDLEAGIDDDVTTRLFIGEPYRYDVIYYPALLVRSGGMRFQPISFNNNRDVVQNEVTRFIDGYGNERYVTMPSYIFNAGAWEGTINIDVETRDHRSRDELSEIIALHFIDTRRWELQNAGVFVKNASIGSPSEVDDRTDKLFKVTVTCDIRTEWHRHTPVQNSIDAINICADLGNLQLSPPALAPNIRINSRVDLVDALVDIS